jgi:flagellar hook-length control protein FliK
VQTDRAAIATNSAASAFVVAATPSRVAEQRVTLTPTLSVVSVAGGGRTAEAPKGGAEGAPRSTVAEQVEHGLQVAMQDLPAPAGERLVTLRLHPSALGSLRISMHVSGDAVNVRFQVGSAKAKAAIGKALDDLKASIAQQGLRVESVEIEEESALAAPDAGIEGKETPLGGPQAARAASGKGFANRLDAPRGPDGPRADDGTGRTPTNPDAEFEGGVLQVLTFRLDAVG